MTANEMFEKLGYTYFDDDGIDTYTTAEKIEYVGYGEILDCKDITFDRLSETMSVYEYYKDGADGKLLHLPTRMCLTSLSKQELEAINKKVEELGWKKSK